LSPLRGEPWISEAVIHELRLPDLGEGVTEGEVVEWLVAAGDHVEEDTPLVEVMTDKASAQIPSPVAGTVESLRVAAGDVVPVGTVLLAIVVEEPSAGAPVPAAPANAAAGASAEQRIPALPATRLLARDLGVDLTAVQGSGREGRVTEDDVRAASGPASAHSRTSSRAANGNPPEAPAGPLPSRIPLRGRRRAIAENLTRAAAVPTVTFVEEAEFDRLDALRTLIEAREGARLSYLPFVVRAVAMALGRMPVLNSRLDEETQEIVASSGVHIGIAVDTDDGLVVPVIRDADRRGVLELGAVVDELAAAARAGTLQAEQLRGSTFTVSSPGRWGGIIATPIINHPEVAILGVHRARPRPVVHDGEIIVRTVGNVSLTFDHRVVDGVAAARFTQLVIDAIEEPALTAL
jgi:pyruvate dehydrogenase E2 component (dihydrolipoyllysine-residue acetyltransferase)